MKKYFTIIILIFVSNIYAQEIFFANSYTESGEPVDATLDLKIKPWGTQVYILFRNDGKPIGDPLLYLFVDKLRGEEYKPFDSRVLNIDKDATWAVYNYEFKDPGKYEVYFMNSKQHRLATAKLNVELEDKYVEAFSVQSSRYYEGAKLEFCEAVVNRKPVNVLRTASIKKLNGTVYVYLNNFDALNVDTLFVQVWKDEDGDNEFEKFIETKKYKINPEWSDTFFKYVFTKAGLYQIKIFEKNEILIAAKHIKIIP